MISFENTDVYGFEAAIRGMRNPLNSWDKSDSAKPDWCNLDGTCPPYQIGENDMGLMTKLVKAGDEHAKFMRMITVTVDITAPLYLWKEICTYRVGVVMNSCSTMHTIHKKEFDWDDFSFECIPCDAEERTEIPCEIMGTDVTCLYTYEIATAMIFGLNWLREKYLETGDKKYWYQMIQLLPSSYNQRRTVQLNYAVLRNIYRQRKGHKLDEWQAFREWAEELPYSNLITEGVERDI